MSYLKNVYGLPEMSLEEELKLSSSEKQTVHNKVRIIDHCDLIVRAVEQIRTRAKGIPVLDDPEHAQLVQQFADLVIKADLLLSEAAIYGIK